MEKINQKYSTAEKEKLTTLVEKKKIWEQADAEKKPKHWDP